MSRETNYWFPAKRYGWGWGLPISWQGWVILVVFIGLVAAGSLLFPPREALINFLVFVFVLCTLLIAVCWIKGEPPRWRWGQD